MTDPRVGGVILTGAVETARLFLGRRPDLTLFAETSGKNATIITSLADRDQAVRDLVRSAFAHNGQKCSAASLAICEAEVYDDPDFRRQLWFASSATSIRFTNTGGGTWASVKDVLAYNETGFEAGIHGFACADPCPVSEGAFATGFAAGGFATTPEPLTLVLLGTGMCCAWVVSRRKMRA